MNSKFEENHLYMTANQTKVDKDLQSTPNGNQPSINYADSNLVRKFQKMVETMNQFPLPKK